jgi:hypothetical protein
MFLSEITSLKSFGDALYAREGMPKYSINFL